MLEDLIKANLNLTALLQNMEELVAFDEEIASLCKDWNISIQFKVIKGPQSHLLFRERRCRFGIGKTKHPSICLLFLSPKHCNNVFEDKAKPIPIKGMTKLRLLTKDFPRLTERLEYYLRPTDELLINNEYLALNTRMTLNTAAFGAKELARLDPVAKLNAKRIQNGALLLKVVNGPAVHLIFEHSNIEVKKGEVDKPMAEISFRDMKIANEFLNGKIDNFAAVASGQLMLKGQIPMIQHIGLILDRLPIYLS